MSLDFEELTPDEADAVMRLVAARGDAPPVPAHPMGATYQGMGEELDEVITVFDQ